MKKKCNHKWVLAHKERRMTQMFLTLFCEKCGETKQTHD